MAALPLLSVLRNANESPPRSVHFFLRSDDLHMRLTFRFAALFMVLCNAFRLLDKVDPRVLLNQRCLDLTLLLAVLR